MKLTHEITIRAPLVKTFAVASNLPRWPEFLPHYRYNRFVSQTPSGGLVRTSCVRSGIKIRWLSEYRIDTKNRQLHFHHLKSTLNAVRGTRAVWDFEELPGGFVRIRISHHLDLKWPIIGPAVANWVAGRFFLHDIAEKTLAGLKRKVETQESLPAVPLQYRLGASEPLQARPRQTGAKSGTGISSETAATVSTAVLARGRGQRPAQPS